MNYIPVELHCHTYHSDGSLSVKDLLNHCKDKGFKLMAITDHNTQAAYYDPEFKEFTGLPVLKGIEWTTFFGHILVMDSDNYVDWRFAKPDDIDVYLKKIKEENGLVGVAHPFNVGSPLCTGCFMDFKIGNWNNVDYIEVWSRERPVNASKNIKAMKLWFDVLNRGYKVAAVSGRDLHGIINDNFANTYVGIDNETVTAPLVKAAIGEGRIYTTLGPILNLDIKNNNETINLGDTISHADISVKLSLDMSNTEAEYGIIPREIRIVNNGKIILESSIDNGFDEFTPEKGWIIFQLIGDYLGESNKVLAFTSPIYIK